MHEINFRLGTVIAVSIGGLALAGWKLGVAPLHERLATASASCSQMESRIEELQRMKLPEKDSLERDLALATQQRARLKAFSVAPDGNKIQERLRNLAAEYNVRIDRLERRNKLGASAENKQPVHTVRETLGFNMSVRGSYSDVASYVRAIAADEGLTRVNALRLAPVTSGDTHAVTAQIETSHMRLVDPHIKDAAKPGQTKGGQAKPGELSHEAGSGAKTPASQRATGSEPAAKPESAPKSTPSASDGEKKAEDRS